ncbi:hypothetical protein, partial [Mesorhizobium sp.]|uniref:hypothetical protein n=1 Tax=Mesorhizobium sp. TaxID=1871066 RepID=UPI0025798FD2
MSHELEEISIVPACTHHFATHGVLFAVGSEGIEAESPKQSEVFGAVILSGPAVVLAEDYVELP